LRNLIAYALLSASLAVSGCAQRNLVDPREYTCDVHHEALREAVVPIRYGWHSEPPYDACEHLFPNANQEVNGGCLHGVNDPVQTRVLYCESCRRAEAVYAEAVLGGKSSWTPIIVGMPGVCPAHGVLLEEGPFGVVDPSAEYPPGYFEARDGRFPFAHSVFEIPKQFRGTTAPTVEYCSQCRKVEAEFLSTHRWNWSGLEDSSSVAKVGGR
jgi:hypothetical protein